MKKASLLQTGAVIGAGVFIFGILPYCWLTGGGSGGMLPYYVIAAVVVLCAVLEGGARLASVLSLLCVTGLLLGWDARNTGFSALAERPDTSLASLAAQLLVILAVLAALLILRAAAGERESAYTAARLRLTENQYRRLLSGIAGLHASGDEQAAEAPDMPYPLLRAMLACRRTAAGENGVGLRLESALPGGLELNEHELCLFLGTLLDYAADACARQKKEGPVISLRLSYKPDYLVAQIAYPAGSAQGPDGGGAKKRSARARLAQVEAVAARQNGLMKIGSEGGTASIHLALPIPSKS